MKKLEIIEDSNKPGSIYGYAFYCPGCKHNHQFPMDGRWTFNGDMQNPEFSPSLLNTMPNDSAYRCHLFLKNGKIEYCGDCSHEFKGQTVDMADFDNPKNF